MLVSPVMGLETDICLYSMLEALGEGRGQGHGLIRQGLRWWEITETDDHHVFGEGESKRSFIHFSWRPKPGSLELGICLLGCPPARTAPLQGMFTLHIPTQCLLPVVSSLIWLRWPGGLLKALPSLAVRDLPQIPVILRDDKTGLQPKSVPFCSPMSLLIIRVPVSFWMVYLYLLAFSDIR